MEIYQIRNLTFSYPGTEKEALSDINFSVSQGEFITLCGKSGCGKTTLLRLLKPILSPKGDVGGNIFFCGSPLQEAEQRVQASQIGFVMQNPDNQVVTDKVWHELAFGLESLGIPTSEIRIRVSEMSSFFGIQDWFRKKVAELSGGQKQLLNLASVMVMQPSVLILDEPTSQLDPIAAQEFLNTLKKINQELGTTIILSEHRLEDAFPMSDRVIVMDAGKIIADDIPQKVGEFLNINNHDMYHALPTPMRIWGGVENSLKCPLTVREGKKWLENYIKNHSADKNFVSDSKILHNKSERSAVELKDVWFRYEKNSPDIIKGLNLKVSRGEFVAIVGGNGVGKSTALSLISGINKPYRGKILIDGREASKSHKLQISTIGVLPQNPHSLFVKNTVYNDLLDVLSNFDICENEKEARINNVADLCRINDLIKISFLE